MKKGTIVKAERRQIGIEILWDGDLAAAPHRHDQCVNPVEDATDMLDGRGVRAGMRVQRLPEQKFRLTGEVTTGKSAPFSPVAETKGATS
jgi:hypothetical protein